MMNGKMAKKIRTLVYGKDFSPRHRKYSYKGGGRVADDKRQRYQQIKKDVSRGVKGWL